MRRWRLPARLAVPVIYHHRVAEAPEYRLETSIVHIANALVRGYGFGFAGDHVMPPVCEPAWSLLDLSQETVTVVMKNLHDELQRNTLRTGMHV